VQLGENQLLLDDSYNANVGSMTAAAHVLAEMPGYRVMVVGDMAELGDESRRVTFRWVKRQKLLVSIVC
jgi:UDP-N-acetylmuramoyl-tripeptide--D-alanyl-D-alanine ligase